MFRKQQKDYTSGSQLVGRDPEMGYGQQGKKHNAKSE